MKTNYTISKIKDEVKNRGFLRCAGVVLNRRFYSNITKKLLPARVISRPVHLQVEISRACNLECKMCEYSLLKNKGQVMNLNDFKKILSQFPLLYSVDLTGIGEAFCNPDFLAILAYASGKGVKAGFATNGLLLNEKNIEEILRIRPDSVTFSLDASTKETYERIRLGGSFDKLRENIRMFSGRLLRSGQTKPELSMNYTISSDNADEAADFPGLARELGINLVFYRDLIVFDSGNYSTRESLFSLSEEERKTLKAKILGKAQGSGVKALLCESLLFAGECRRKFCYRPWMSSFVDVYGNFYPCCHFTQKGMDIRQFSFANLMENRFDKAWNDSKMVSLRKALLNPNAVPFFCKECGCLIR